MYLWLECTVRASYSRSQPRTVHKVVLDFDALACSASPSKDENITQSAGDTSIS
jgi:hypothetical protein